MVPLGYLYGYHANARTVSSQFQGEDIGSHPRDKHYGWTCYDSVQILSLGPDREPGRWEGGQLESNAEAMSEPVGL